MISTTIIRPQTGLLSLNIPELWRHRELFLIFAWRDIKVRYKQTILGVLWVILQPIVSTLVFTIFFGNLAKIPSGELPYSLFVLIGLVFWNFFSGSLTAASNSLVSNENIIKKVYFPKIILPLSSIITSFVDFLVSLIVLLVYAFYLGYIPNITSLYIIPLMVFFTAFSSIGLGLFFSSLNVKYRDVRYALPYLFQTVMFLTPVIYSLDIVSQSNSRIMALNPMTSVIELVRSLFSVTNNTEPMLLVISLFSAVTTFFIGYWFFSRTEKYFSDIA